MRNVDLIFVIGLGIAMGSILGKLWIVTPTGLMLYQAALICVVWWVLRVFIDYLQILQRFITQWWGTPPGFWISGAEKDVKAVHPHKTTRPAAASRSSQVQTTSTLDKLLTNLERF